MRTAPSAESARSDFDTSAGRHQSADWDRFAGTICSSPQDLADHDELGPGELFVDWCEIVDEPERLRLIDIHLIGHGLGPPER
jgi:hypothetical protein|tara:strand:- start:509 stop:757 length:249 start_codon:yes stop_codon:yes gene_type:complete